MKKAKHIIEYIFFSLLMKILKIMPIEKAAQCCSYIARKIGPRFGVTNIARNNLKKALGDDIDTERIIDDLWDNFGRYIGEFPFINEMGKEELEKRVNLKGHEHVEAFKKAKQPFLMFLGHQANWDFVIRRINGIYPKFGVIYRKSNNPYVDTEILKERGNDPNIIMIAKGRGGVKDLVRAIKSGHSIAMLVDQKMNDGIEVPFFDMPAMTAPAIARLSLQYGYPIIPAQLVRVGRSSNFEFILHPALEYNKSGDREKDCYNIMLKINKTLEGWIRQKPGQWFWFHNRWK